MPIGTGKESKPHFWRGPIRPLRYSGWRFPILMSRAARRIRDKGLLRLLGKYLRAGVVVDGRLNRTVRGVPLRRPVVTAFE